MLIKLEQKLMREYEKAFFTNHKSKYTLLKILWGISKLLNYASSSLRFSILKFQKYDVLIINPLKLDCEKGVPVGIVTIVSYLQKYGIRVYLLDMNLNKTNNKSLTLLIKKTEPLVIGIGAITYQVNEAYRLGRVIKAVFPKAKLVYGGVHPTFVTDEAFKEGEADFVVIGEGEQTMLELFKLLKSGRTDFSKIAGLAYKKESNVTKNKPRRFIQNLNSLPFPAYYKLNLEDYNTDLHVYPYYNELAVDLIMSRGCPNDCAYCATPQMYHHHIRLRDAKNIIAEVESLQKKHGMNYFHFHDDNFLIERQRVVQFCYLIIKKGIRIAWVCLTDINTLKRNKDIIPMLASAGCIGIEVGIENADAEVLKGLNRRQDISSLSALDKAMKDAGITPLYLFMSFLPGETLDSIYKTSKLLDKLNKEKCPDVIEFLRPVHSRFGFGLCANPYPGSRFFYTASNEGILLAKSWKSYHPFCLNFIPHSLLQDIPIKRRTINKKEFNNALSRYEKEILYNRTHNLRHHIFPEGKELSGYKEFLYTVFKLCDGRMKVQELCNILKSAKETFSMREVCSAIRFLAMFGLIKSKNVKKVVQMRVQK